MWNLIPTPRKTTLSDTRVAIAPLYTADAPCADAAATLAEYSRRAHGISWTAGDGGIRFTTEPSLPAEGYVITVTESGVSVRAADGEGAQHAAVTLIQLMEKNGDGFTLPVGEIEDSPLCTWRAVMIDVAREWHKLSLLFEYVDMCCFYKIKHLHLHFSDDQSYTLPSKAYPNLPTEGRHYTEDEIKRLTAYAKSRGVQIVPEIDVPGHATSFSAAYPALFGADGLICQSEESVRAMETIFRELCEMFPDSEYIHMGGDEAAIDRWTRCDQCLNACRHAGLDVDKYLETDESRRELAELMYATFVQRICNVILSCGHTPVVWEGFHKSMNHMIPRETLVISWENFYQVAPDLLADGFRVVNGAWVPMYVCTPQRYWSVQEVYHWSIYHWGVMHPKSPYVGKPLTIEPTEQVEGGMLLAWGDAIRPLCKDIQEGILMEQRLVEERAPALAENVWTREKPLTWAEFSPKLEAVSRLYHTFRSNP